MFAGQLIWFIGRKNTLLLSALVHATGWLCIAFGNNFAILLLGRVITGLATGTVALTFPVFISEVSPKHIRGLLDTMCTTSILFGILMSYVMGKWLDYSWLAVAALCPPVLLILVLPWLAESPRRLLLRGDHDAAFGAFQFYRGSNAMEEYDAMKANALLSVRFSLRDLRLPHVYKPLLYSMCALVLQQFSGIVIVLFYTHDIFSAAGLALSAPDSTIIIGAVNFLCVGMSAPFVDRLGRRILLLFSLVVTGVSLIVLGLFNHFKMVHGSEFVDSYGWVPLASLCLYSFGFSVGLSPLPSVLMGEMLPLRIRSFAAGALICLFFTCGTIIAKEYHDMLVFFGEDGIYWFYGSFMAVGFVIVAILFPETKGKTLEEIETFFNQQRANNMSP